ncbi:MAG: hypothetical protein NC203_06060 [Firmicutes bacterium]|nr:hypothetical protein [[Eubacterium] siraeum]MCM1487915.1 hypothetical protein [Bacillota bacterium]
MFEFLKRLFGKKSDAVQIRLVPLQPGEAVCVDLRSDRITINQSVLTLPIDIMRLIQILGEPRVQQFETKLEDKEFLEKLHSGAQVTNRANYMWDGLGIKCYTLDGTTVNTIGVELNQGFLEYPHIPQNKFAGTVTIEGKPWLSEINKGVDCNEILRQLYLGNYLLTAEYTDFEQISGTPSEKDYTGIEIQCNTNNR